MWLQRIHTEYALRRRRGEQVDLEDVDVAENRTWRPFQLAFVLLSLPTVTDPTHEDRANPTAAVADLLWFPTGGGKTEAYLGVAAFAMGLRRLQGEVGGLDGRRGVDGDHALHAAAADDPAVPTSLDARCARWRSIRREALDEGRSELGARAVPDRALGGSHGRRRTRRRTPQRRSRTPQGHVARRRDRHAVPADDLPLVRFEIEPGRDLMVDEGHRPHAHVLLRHWTGGCEFTKQAAPGEGIPVVVVDEEIYRLLLAADRDRRQVRADAVEGCGRQPVRAGRAALPQAWIPDTPTPRTRAPPRRRGDCQRSSRSTSGRSGRPI